MNEKEEVRFESFPPLYLHFFQWRDAECEFLNTLGSEGDGGEGALDFDDNAVAKGGVRYGVSRAEGV